MMVKRVCVVIVVILMLLTSLHYAFSNTTEPAVPITLTFILNKVSEFEPIVSFEDTAWYYTNINNNYNDMMNELQAWRDNLPSWLDWLAGILEFILSFFASVFILFGIIFNGGFYIISFLPFLFSLFM